MLQNLLGNVARHLRHDARFAGLIFFDKRTPFLCRAIIIFALIYLICPVDLIPDKITIFGYADDVVLLLIGRILARRMIPPILLAERRHTSAARSAGVGNEVWVLVDDRIGNTNQSMGVAEKIGLPMRVLNVRYDQFIRLPNLLRGKSLIGLDLESARGLDAPWPKMVVGTGRRLAPVSRFIKMMSDGETKTVQIMDPEVGRADFDLVVIPNHDKNVSAAQNVLRTTGAPNRMTSDRLKQEGDAWRQAVAPMPRPWIVLLVGGNTRFFEFNPEMAHDFGVEASQAARRLGGALLVTSSRRTSPETLDAVLKNVDAPTYVHRWTTDGLNPFFGFLALADYIIVTGDSMSMCTEACQSAKPVYIFAPEAMTSEKYRRLHAELYDKGVARPFDGQLDADWQQPMTNPTDQVAQSAMKLLGAAR